MGRCKGGRTRSDNGSRRLRSGRIADDNHDDHDKHDNHDNHHKLFSVWPTVEGGLPLGVSAVGTSAFALHS